MQWLADSGLDGALVLGTNGEFASFSLDERRRVAESAVAARDQLQLMLGVGACALPEVCELLRVAAGSGYRSVLCPPPFYFRSAPVNGVADFFRWVLDAASLPVLLYHIPQVTGIAISDRLLELIGDHDNLAGVKDSSDSLDEMQRLSRRFTDRAYFVGSDRLISSCREIGGAGSISAAANVVPSLVASVQQGGPDQPVLDSVRSLLERHGLGPAVKAILRRAGFGDYATRPPLGGLDSEQEDELWRAYCELVPPEDRPGSG